MQDKNDKQYKQDRQDNQNQKQNIIMSMTGQNKLVNMEARQIRIKIMAR